MADPIVSRRVIVKGDKAGLVRAAASLPALVDAVESTRIEETPSSRKYVKPLAPMSLPPPPQEYVAVASPSAPPLETRDEPVVQTSYKSSYDISPPTTPPRSHESCGHPTDILCAILGIVVGMYVLWALDQWITPQTAVLTHVSWTFRGQVSEYRTVTDEGWDLPQSAVALTSRERQHSTWSVLDHEETTCHMETVAVPVLSHYETKCTRIVTGTTPELEAYSHTEEVCYASGRCEEQDVYTKIPGQPVYQEVCEQVPVYTTAWVPTEKCHTERVMRDEPVVALYWTYTIQRAVPTRVVTYDTTEGGTRDIISPPDVDSLLHAGEHYSNRVYDYYLYFDNNQTKQHVTNALYHRYKDRVGKIIEVPR